jgi:hypothetical protein
VPINNGIALYPGPSRSPSYFRPLIVCVRILRRASEECHGYSRESC